MRNRLERVTEISDGSSTARGKGSSKLRDAIPTADELSSAVSRMNVAPWEDPFSLALGEASIAEEGEWFHLDTICEVRQLKSGRTRSYARSRADGL